MGWNHDARVASGNLEVQACCQGAIGRVKPGHALIDDKIVPVKNWTDDLR
jgi:hypothetical protein